MGKIKIVHLQNQFGKSAISNVIFPLVNHLPKSRYELEVWSLGPLLESTITTALEKKKVELFSFGSNQKFSLKLVSDLIKKIKETNPDIIQLHGGRSNFLVGIIAKIVAEDLFVISTIHNVKRNFRLPIKIYFDKSPGLVDATCCVSEVTEKSFFGEVYSVDDYLENGRINHFTIENSVNVKDIRSKAIFNNKAISKKRNELGLDNKEKVIINVGSLESQKNQNVLLKSFKILQTKGFSESSLLILGEGSLEASLKQKVRELEIEDKVSFLGHREDIYEILSIGDLFVSTTKWESISLAHLEVMALKLPIISSKIPSMQELLVDGQDALLVKPDNAKGFANAIGSLLTDERLRKELAGSAYRKVKNEYDIKIMIKKYKKLYEELANIS